MRGKLSSDTQGAALIEAALILPVLLVVVFGMAELALFIWQTNSAEKAVQLGARQAIVSPSVAVGAGLTPDESETYWSGLPLGERCAPAANGSSICPVFTVTCRVTVGCVCEGSSCKFTLSESRLVTILTAMRAALPRLRPEQVEISYANNYLGYVGQPLPVPVDVRVTIVDLHYDMMFLGGKLGPSIPITASAVFPSEHMQSTEVE